MYSNDKVPPLYNLVLALKDNNFFEGFLGEWRNQVPETSFNSTSQTVAEQSTHYTPPEQYFYSTNENTEVSNNLETEVSNNAETEVIEESTEMDWHNYEPQVNPYLHEVNAENHSVPFPTYLDEAQDAFLYINHNPMYPQETQYIIQDTPPIYYVPFDENSYKPTMNPDNYTDPFPRHYENANEIDKNQLESVSAYPAENTQTQELKWNSDFNFTSLGNLRKKLIITIQNLKLENQFEIEKQETLKNKEDWIKKINVIIESDIDDKSKFDFIKDYIVFTACHSLEILNPNPDLIQRLMIFCEILFDEERDLKQKLEFLFSCLEKLSRNLKQKYNAFACMSDSLYFCDSHVDASNLFIEAFKANNNTNLVLLYCPLETLNFSLMYIKKEDPNKISYSEESLQVLLDDFEDNEFISKSDNPKQLDLDGIEHESESLRMAYHYYCLKDLLETGTNEGIKGNDLDKLKEIIRFQFNFGIVPIATTEWFQEATDLYQEFSETFLEQFENSSQETMQNIQLNLILAYVLATLGKNELSASDIKEKKNLCELHLNHPYQPEKIKMLQAGLCQSLGLIPPTISLNSSNNRELLLIPSSQKGNLQVINPQKVEGRRKRLCGQRTNKKDSFQTSNTFFPNSGPLNPVFQTQNVYGNDEHYRYRLFNSKSSSNPNICPNIDSRITNNTDVWGVDSVPRPAKIQANQPPRPRN